MIGAHIFSEILLALGLNASKATGILDNSKSKRLDGSNFNVFSQCKLSQYNSPTVLFRVDKYNEKISKNTIKNLPPCRDYLI
ncbi:hypothetical protein N9P85_00615 [Amylibacter sp.]|nr:hypothetical protein [Amylibacter sp.]